MNTEVIYIYLVPLYYTFSLFDSLKQKEVFKSSSFNEMSEESLAFILKSDKLNMDELDLLEKVKEWAQVNSVRQHFNCFLIC